MATAGVVNKIEETILNKVRVLRFVDNNDKPIRLSRNKFRCQFNCEKNDRKKHIDLEKEIEYIWQDKVNSSKVFDGEKFRLGKMQMRDENTIEIQLGLTSYKDIIGTTQNLRANYWVQKGIQEYQNPRTYMSDGLGCGILVFTQDDYLLVTRRSQWTGECPDMFDRPGGHAEPEKIINSKQINKDVTNELWFSSLDELEAEVGIHRKEVCQYDFLGLSLNSGSADRPSLEFCAKLNIDADDVNNRYRLGNQAEANESSSLVLLSKSKFQQLFTLLDNHCIDKRDDLGQESKEIEEILQISTPALQGAIYMFGKLRE